MQNKLIVVDGAAWLRHWDGAAYQRGRKRAWWIAIGDIGYHHWYSSDGDRIVGVLKNWELV